MYTMKEVCQIVGWSYETLKYYCKEGLIPNVKRDKNNYRVFDENNIEPFKDNRMDYAPKGYSLVGVYYAIKFSKVIYETDEYDHPLTSTDATDFT